MSGREMKRTNEKRNGEYKNDDDDSDNESNACTHITHSHFEKNSSELSVELGVMTDAAWWLVR